MSIILIGLAFLNLFYSFDCYSKTHKIVMIIASSNFRDEEFKIPKELFEKNGYSITVASGSLSESVGMLGMKVRPDITLDKVKVVEFDAVVFVGGSGSAEYFTNNLAQKIAKDAFAQGKTLAAICLAPVILANAGLLKGKKATCNDPEAIIKKGAYFTGKPVEQDGKIITGIGPEASEEFAEAILRSCKHP
jgi:protease I